MLGKIKFKLFKILSFSISKIISIIYKDKSPKLPEIIFLFGTVFFPQINVELIIRDEKNNTLYIWRDDFFENYGWHLPGGIIRPNEEIINRVKRVIQSETLVFNHVKKITGPITISEVLNEKPGFRSHFISLVYLVIIENNGKLNNKNLSYSKSTLTNSIPKPLIKNHERYVELLKKENDFLSAKVMNKAK